MYLDVSMNEVLYVDVFDTANHLVGQHQNSLHCKAAATEVEEVFQRGSKEILNVSSKIV